MTYVHQYSCADLIPCAPLGKQGRRQAAPSFRRDARAMDGFLEHVAVGGDFCLFKAARENMSENLVLSRSEALQPLVRDSA
jgi:hypothetical protein